MISAEVRDGILERRRHGISRNRCRHALAVEQLGDPVLKRHFPH